MSEPLSFLIDPPPLDAGELLGIPPLPELPAVHATSLERGPLPTTVRSPKGLEKRTRNTLVETPQERRRRRNREAARQARQRHKRAREELERNNKQLLAYVQKLRTVIKGLCARDPTLTPLATHLVRTTPPLAPGPPLAPLDPAPTDHFEK